MIYLTPKNIPNPNLGAAVFLSPVGFPLISQRRKVEAGFQYADFSASL